MNTDIGPEPRPQMAQRIPRGAIDDRLRAKIGAGLLLAMILLIAGWFLLGRKSAPTAIGPRPAQRMAVSEDERRHAAQQAAMDEADRRQEEVRRRNAMDATYRESGAQQTGQPIHYPAADAAPSPAITRAEQLAEMDRKAAFEDNLVEIADRQHAIPGLPSGAPNAAPQQETQSPKPPQGKLLPEGTFLDCTLVNEMNGDFTGPVLVSLGRRPRLGHRINSV